MITVIDNKNSSSNIDLWFSDSTEKKEINDESKNIKDGIYHRPKNSIPTMNRYGMFADSKIIDTNPSKNISNIPLALSYDEIDDYTKIPQSVFIDWKHIISMNDGPGNFHGFITADKRSQILSHITKWKTANNY